ncbi:NAD(P)/FAD-dependent oxidoreductase [Hyphomicrobium sp.]|uniref:NAD(P)/FAD-dependent oxidoreductase n=1 Tax=Hyphomicrobium sp. TaxID=82 RepID=UPI002E30DB24|nr:NAD(P)/FAD-dependent oxidoreductase [Hyphomicrobium sp.]HEX2843436.1 NAD(P)/FAD-dependent oxidoreductase [Hyphomicrobium sp.]
MRNDAIIIGGSFAGLSAAIQLARANRSVCVVDTGTPRNRFASASHGFFGQDGLPPYEMLATAREKVAAYPSVRFVDSAAVQANADEGGFAVTLADGRRLLGRKLALAFGLKDTLPDIPGVTERWGQTVLHCPYCHGFEFLGRPLGVLSVLPLSVHQAQLIPEWGPTTFFLNGGAIPDEPTRALLAARHVTIETAPIIGLEGDAPKLDGVRLADGRLVEIAALYLAPRTSFQSDIASQLGCALENGPVGPVIKTDAMKLTSVPGVYAAGDITRPMHNATFASADGVMAGTAIHRELVFQPLAA